MTTANAAQLSLDELHALLPAPPLPLASYIAVTRVGNLIYTSGVLPMKEGAVAYTGAVGTWNMSADHGKEAAKLCVLNALSLVHHELGGSLAKVKRIVKVTGFVSSPSNFYDQPTVMNGASDFLVQAFGEAGKHVRSAVGVAALPKDASVELELIVEVEA